MTEEVKVEEPKKEVVVETSEPSPVEMQAREQGWVSKEEWVESGRDEGEWRPAKEFVDRGELYKSLHATKRELKQAQATLTALQRHHNYVFDRAHKQAVETLKKERRVAFKDDDLDRVEEIEAEIETREKEHAQAMQQVVAEQRAAQPVNNPEFNTWADKNQWYMTDTDLRDFADATGIVYMNRNPGSTPSIVLNHVEKEVRRKFPEKFGIKKAAPNAVASVDKTHRPAKTGDDFELTEMERSAMQTFVRQGIMTEAQYRAELKKVGR